MLPNKFLQKAATLKFAKSTMCVHTCIACQVCFNILASMQSGYRRALLAKSMCTDIDCACWLASKMQCVATPAVLAIRHFHNSKCHFLKWKSAATAALSAPK